jgi:hypothetical protein
MTYNDEDRNFDEEDEIREMAEATLKEVMPFKAILAGKTYTTLEDEAGNEVKAAILTFSTTLSLEDVRKLEDIATAKWEIEVMVSPVQPLESEMSLFKPEA